MLEIFWNLLLPILGGGLSAWALSHWVLDPWSEGRRQRRRNRALAGPWQAATTHRDLGWADRMVAHAEAVELLWNKKQSGIRCYSDPADGRCVFSLTRFGVLGAPTAQFAGATGLFSLFAAMWIANQLSHAQDDADWHLLSWAFLFGWLIGMVYRTFTVRRRHHLAQIIVDQDCLYLRTKVGGTEEVAFCPRRTIDAVRGQTAPEGRSWMPLADIAFFGREASPTFFDLTGYRSGLNDGTAELLAKQLNAQLAPPPASVMVRSA